MPVIGPDLDFAREKGNKIGTELLDKLIEENKLLDVTGPKFPSQYHTLPNARQRWDKAKIDFIKAVEELFVEDACNGW